MISVTGLGDVNFEELGIPSGKDYIQMYENMLGKGQVPNIEFYLAFVCFRFAAILQGVYKRYTQGRGSAVLRACPWSMAVSLNDPRLASPILPTQPTFLITLPFIGREWKEYHSCLEMNSWYCEHFSSGGK